MSTSDYQYIEIAKNGSASVLQVQSADFDETLHPDEVIIDVKYSGVNFADILMRLGVYRDAPPKPFVPGYELSGIVKKVGNSVTRFKVGDSVMAGSKFGGYVNKITLPDWQVMPLPPGFNLPEAAALPVNFITAYLAFSEFGHVREGDKVLIDCATGGVGTVFLQMCAQTRAHAHGLTSNPAKKEYIKSLGAQAYTWAEFEQSGEKDFDFILNSSGGKTLKPHYQLLAKSGKLCCIGMQSMVKDGKGSFFKMIRTALATPWFPILKLVMESKSVSGFNALKYFDDDAWMKKHLVQIEKTSIKPHIGKVFKAQEVAAAHQCLELRQTTGKVLLEWAD